MAHQAMTRQEFEQLPTEEMVQGWGELLRETRGKEDRVIYRSGRKIIYDIRYRTPVGWIENRQAWDYETGQRVPVGEDWSNDDFVPLSVKLRKRFER